LLYCAPVSRLILGNKWLLVGLKWLCMGSTNGYVFFRLTQLGGLSGKRIFLARFSTWEAGSWGRNRRPDLNTARILELFGVRRNPEKTPIVHVQQDSIFLGY